MHTRNEVSSATETGAVVGAVIGSLLSFMFPPLGAALGAAGGASLNEGVDGSFVREVQASLRPGTSALFVVAREGNVEAVVAALESYQGTVRQTNLPTEVEESLRRALR